MPSGMPGSARETRCTTSATGSSASSSPRPSRPRWRATPTRMVEEEGAQTGEGARVRARQAVFRRLLDDPVVYLDELDDRAREWLEGARAALYERLERDVGLAVERRAEGLAAHRSAG